MEIKKILKKVNALLPVTAGFPKSYVIPIYHCVSNDDLPHIKNIIGYKNVRDFESDLDWLSTHFEFADWDFFKLNYNRKKQKPTALLTFDDGYAEFREVVIPLLKRKGIYAVNFINPKFIGNRDLMFRCKLSILAEQVKKNGIPAELSLFLGIENALVSTVVDLILSIKDHHSEQLSSIASLLNVDFSDYLHKHKVYLDYEDLAYAKDEGFGIAAHSWDHPYYQHLSLSEQLETTQKSIDFMRENHFLSDIFAFPFTDFRIENQFFEKIFSENNDLAFTFGTAGLKTDSFERNLQRIPMENGFSAEDEIHFEKNYFLLKKLLKKNEINRR